MGNGGGGGFKNNVDSVDIALDFEIDSKKGQQELAKFGYYFNKKGQCRSIKTDERVGRFPSQKEYEQFGAALERFIFFILRDQYKMTEIKLKSNDDNNDNNNNNNDNNNDNNDNKNDDNNDNNNNNINNNGDDEDDDDDNNKNKKPSTNKNENNDENNKNDKNEEDDDGGDVQMEPKDDDNNNDNKQKEKENENEKEKEEKSKKKDKNDNENKNKNKNKNKSSSSTKKGDVDESKVAKSRIYLSPKYGEKETLLLLIPGSGAVRAGQWARSICINDNLAAGCMYPYIAEAYKRDWGVVLFDPNGRTDGGRVFSDEHVEYVYNKYVEELYLSKKNCSIKNILIVCHSAGGMATTRLLNDKIKYLLPRIRGVAGTDTFFGRAKNNLVEKIYSKYIVNWVTSSQPLGTILSNTVPKRVSAGHNSHEYTSASAFIQIFNYFDAMLKLHNNQSVKTKNNDKNNKQCDDNDKNEDKSKNDDDDDKNKNKKKEKEKEKEVVNDDNNNNDKMEIDD